jgi:serine/threonine protein kinase
MVKLDLLHYLVTLARSFVHFVTTRLQVFELAGGGELFDHCVNVNGNGPMPEKGLQLAARQLLRGLACAHFNGIVHLDLKMENILLKNCVTRDDWNDGLDAPDAPIQLKISAWGTCTGLAVKDFDADWLRFPPGTEGYRFLIAPAQNLLADLLFRAPETILKHRRVSGAQVTVASDLFSFGCVLCVHIFCVFVQLIFLCLVPSFRMFQRVSLVFVGTFWLVECSASVATKSPARAVVLAACAAASATNSLPCQRESPKDIGTH